MTVVAVAGAVAIAAFAGGRLVSGATANTQTAFVPIVPCRLMDTRPDTQVGPRGTPLGQSEAYPATVWGGACGIPQTALGISMNVTVVNGTAASFLTIWPPDATSRPEASNLNWGPGSPPTPNKVDVKLSDKGKVSFYNRFGSVDIIADIVGYYEKVTSGVGPQGPPGPPGPVGPQGPASPVGTLTVISVPIVIEPNDVGNGSNGSNTAECPDDMLAISGGVENSNGVAINVRSSRPNPVGVNPTGWFGDVRSPIDASDETATVYAVCVNP
jgi:hypothetical protein